MRSNAPPAVRGRNIPDVIYGEVLSYVEIREATPASNAKPKVAYEGVRIGIGDAGSRTRVYVLAPGERALRLKSVTKLF